MKTIYKYFIWQELEEWVDDVRIKLPDGAEVLRVGFQDRALCLWALVDPSCTLKNNHSFRVTGTGHPIDTSGYTYFEYLASAECGDLVFHVFETTPWKQSLK